MLEKLLGDCLKGLAALHEVGLVHRDLKETNLIILPTGGDEAMAGTGAS